MKISKKVRQEVYEKYNGHCAYCGEKIEYKKMQVDHIHAKYLGGENDIENYNPSCRQCNFYKSTEGIEGLRKSISTLNHRLRKPFIFRLAEKYGIVEVKEWDGIFYFEKEGK